MRNADPPTLPSALRRGDSVGLFTPSLPAAAWYPERLEHALAGLQKSLQVRVVVSPQTRRSTGFCAGSAAERAAALRDLVRDEQIRAIFTTLGGFNSAEILPFLDIEELRAHPKILVGYSDATSLLLGIHAVADWCTFHGPAILTQFGEFPEPHAYTIEAFRRVAMTSAPAGTLEDPPFWTTEFLDWNTGAWRSRARKPCTPAGRSVWRSGSGAGALYGGNLETLNFLIGTPYFKLPPAIVLFWEATEAEAHLPRIQRALTHLRQCGVLDRTRAMLIGRSPDAIPQRGIDLRSVVLDVLGDYKFPIVADLAFGHTDPMMTLPIGIPAEVEAEPAQARIRIAAAAVR